MIIHGDIYFYIYMCVYIIGALKITSNIDITDLPDFSLPSADNNNNLSITIAARSCILSILECLIAVGANSYNNKLLAETQGVPLVLYIIHNLIPQELKILDLENGREHSEGSEYRQDEKILATSFHLLSLMSEVVEVNNPNDPNNPPFVINLRVN